MKLNLAKDFGNDTTKEQNGIWVPYGDLEFLVARAGGTNNRSAKLYESLTKPYRKQIQMKTLPDDKLIEISVEVMARTVLLDWKGVKEEVEETDKNGKVKKVWKDVPYSWEVGKEALIKYPDLMLFISDFAADKANFKEVDIEGYLNPRPL